MKKIHIIFIFALTILLILCGLVACQNSTEDIPTHTHILSVNNEMPATCESDGNILYYSCDLCGKWFSDDEGTKEITSHSSVIVTKLDHSWNNGVITKQATCTETGVMTFTCITCSTTKMEDIATVPHQYSTEFTIDNAATCSEEGSKSRHCINCDSKTQDTSIDKIAHTVVTDNAIEPTCTTIGLTEGSHCSVCHTILKTQDEVKATGHQYEDEYVIDVYATSTHNGIKSKHCKFCDSKTDTIDYQATVVSGTLADEQLHWTKGCSPYCISNNILVKQDKTLIIDPGVDIYIEGEYYIQIEGDLQAVGTENERICFYGINEGYNKWMGIKVISLDLDTDGEGANVIYKSGSILKYAIVNDCGSGFKGNFYIDNSIVNTSEWAIGQSSYVGCEFTGIVKDSIINGKVDVVRGRNTSFINCTISTPQFISASEEDENSKISFYNCKITHVNGNAENYNGDFKISSNTAWGISTNITAIFENTIIEGFTFFYVTGTDSIVFKNCNIVNNNRMCFSYGNSSSTVCIEACNILKTTLEFERKSDIFRYNNLNGVIIKVHSARTLVPEIDMENNYWGADNLTELEQASKDYNLSFIEDYYDNFNVSLVIYDNYATEPFNNSGVLSNEIKTN